MGQMKIFLFLLTFVLVIYARQMQSDIFISHEVVSKDLNRELSVELENIDLTNWYESDCVLSVQLVLNDFENCERKSETTEISDVNRKEAIVNIERISPDSDFYIIYIFLPENVGTFLFTLPLDLKYQKILIFGKYGKVQATESTISIQCPPKSGSLLSCSYTAEGMCIDTEPEDLEKKMWCQFLNEIDDVMLAITVIHLNLSILVILLTELYNRIRLF